MTVKEAVLISLQELRKLSTHTDVYNHIIKNNHYDFGDAKTPAQTISATLGDFIRKGDSRIKRVKNEKRNFAYYLSTLEGEIDLEKTQLIETGQKKNHVQKQSYNERDLHILLSSYLNNQDVFSKTISGYALYSPSYDMLWFFLLMGSPTYCM